MPEAWIAGGGRPGAVSAGAGAGLIGQGDGVAVGAPAGGGAGDPGGLVIAAAISRVRADRPVRACTLVGWSAEPGGEVGEVEARGDHAADQDLLNASRPG